MKARAASAGGRLSAGTGRMLYAVGDVLDVPTGAGFVGRLGAVLGLGAFGWALVLRAPGLVYAVPLVWLAGAWVSGSSATPPPGGAAPLDGEEAGQSAADGTTLVRREGMLIYLTDDPDNPARTHVHVERDDDATE